MTGQPWHKSHRADPTGNLAATSIAPGSLLTSESDALIRSAYDDARRIRESGFDPGPAFLFSRLASIGAPAVVYELALALGLETVAKGCIRL